MIELPAAVRAMAARGPEWTAWVDDLAAVTQGYLDQWELTLDGTPTHGSGSIALPVRTSDRSPAVLKIGFPAPDTEHEHLVLRRWGGDGAVRLLRADPHRRAMLLERLRPETLATLPDVDACEVVAALYRRLHVPALPQLRALTSQLEQWTSDLETLPRSAPIPHRLVEQAAALSRDLAAEPDITVVHGNLHYDNVLAADREPWLAIAPTPLNGDPHYELAPMLWHRWDELAGHVRDGVRRRFYTLVDAAGFEEARARAWVIVRVVLEATRELTNVDSTNLTKYVALAKAVQD
ncbi:MAG TPA: aminoglycoside phosphotransferase family protein [Mycobacterium sp.]|nr:aminoglycoside phosphotransferase family protein [Mycobacterium sp.]